MLALEFEERQNWVKINGKKHTLWANVIEALPFADRVVVLLNTAKLTEDHPFLSNNVVAFDADGTVLWRIEPMKVTFTGRDGKEHPHPYFGIEKHPDGTLWAFGAMGSLRPVDLATGRTGKPIRVDK